MSATIDTDERLRYEARTRPRAALVAALAAVLILGAALLQLFGPHAKVDELTLDLITANRRRALDLAAAVVNGLGSLALAATLIYLFGATRARNPRTSSFIPALAGIGAVLAAVAGIVDAVLIGTKAHQFVTSTALSYPEAKNLTSGTAFAVVPNLALLGALLLAISYVMVSLNAMRVGLLTRFMGYLGMLAGALVLFPQFTPLPVVQAYWLLALAYMLAGRWPTGVPAAWQTGHAEKLPTAAETREQRARAAAGQNSRAKTAPEPEPVGAPAAPAARSAAKRKRKRKR